MPQCVTDPRDMFLLREADKVSPGHGREFPDPRARMKVDNAPGTSEAKRRAPELHLTSQPPTPEREIQQETRRGNIEIWL